MIARDETVRLYKIGGVAALTIPLFYLVAGVATGIGYNTQPVPGDAAGWFALFQNTPLLGFVYLGVQDVAIAILSVPLFLALYQVHKPVSRTWALVATVFAIVGITVYLAMHSSFSVFSLSSQYARATTEARKATLLAGGQALIADPRAGFGMAIIWASSILLSILMVRGKVFGVVTAIMGIAGFSFFLLGVTVPAGYTSTDALTAGETVITSLSIAGGGLLTLAWYILVGLKLLRLEGSEIATS